MARKTFPSRRYPQPDKFTLGPFTGMTDADSPAASDKNRCFLIRNAYKVAGGKTIRLVGRPGFGAGVAAGAGPIQYLGQFTKTDGTKFRVAVSAGEIYTADTGYTTWTKQVSTANLTTASITLSGTARVRGCPFFNTLVLSDGTNVPFTWDGTAGAGGLVKLTNGPSSVYGQMVNHYSKLFDIKGTEKSAIAWSEEGTANTGYEAGGYNNAWTLAGAKGEPITALLSRNDALWIIRPRSTTTIVGAVNDQFKTTANLPSISNQTGTMSPDGVLSLDEGVVVLDADGFPQYAPAGGTYTSDPSMGDDCRVTMLSTPRAAYSNAMYVYDPEHMLIYLGIGDSATNNMSRMLVFEATGGQPNFTGVWDGWTSTAMAMMDDSTGTPRLLHGDSTGKIYLHDTSSGTTWTDAGVPITHEIVGPAVAYDTDVEARFDEITLTTFSETGMTNVALDYVTPYGDATTAQTLSFSASGFVLDESILDEAYLESGSGELRQRAGIFAFGRWMRPRVRHSTSGERFGVELMTVTAAAEGLPAGAK